jgi:hypothetical protein
MNRVLVVPWSIAATNFDMITFLNTCIVYQKWIGCILGLKNMAFGIWAGDNRLGREILHMAQIYAII